MNPKPLNHETLNKYSSLKPTEPQTLRGTLNPESRVTLHSSNTHKPFKVTQ